MPRNFAIKRLKMNKLYIVLLALTLVGCARHPQEQSVQSAGQSAANIPVDIPSIGVTAGSFNSGNSDDIKVRSFTVNGTDCIWAGSYKSSSLSCNWK